MNLNVPGDQVSSEPGFSNGVRHGAREDKHWSEPHTNQLALEEGEPGRWQRHPNVLRQMSWDISRKQPNVSPSHSPDVFLVVLISDLTEDDNLQRREVVNAEDPKAGQCKGCLLKN